VEALRLEVGRLARDRSALIRALTERRSSRLRQDASLNVRREVRALRVRADTFEHQAALE